MLRYGKNVYCRQLGELVHQVNVKTARRYYNKGVKVYMLPCNMRLDNPWMGLCPVQKGEFETSFDTHVRDFTTYICDKERGKYPIYFVKKADY